MSTKPVTPYASSNSKNQQGREMLNRISNRYDSLNSILSLGVHRYWRKACLNEIKKKTTQPKFILDVATGTGDFALTCLNLNPEKITGIDISEGMLEKGRKKIKKNNLEGRIELKYGDSEKLSFPDNNFDAVTVGFGVRNFENLEQGLREIYRVLRPGGTFVVLEFSKPVTFPVKQLYNFYFNNILPFFGKLVSKDNSAYTYLPESVKSFPDGENFKIGRAHV